MKIKKKEQPLVYVMVVTYNGKKNIEKGFPSLSKTKYENMKVLLVDNHSTDGTVDYARKVYPGIEIIENPKNLYFAGGANIGIKFALKRNADYIAFLNDDTLVDKMWLKCAVEVCEGNKEVGFVEFDLGDPNLEGNIKEFKRKQREFKDLRVYDSEVTNGCALLIRCDVFKKVGLIDEMYMLYGEETDLIRRAKRAGFTAKKINVPIFHKGGASGKRMKLRISYLNMRNLLRLTIKNDSPFQVIKMFLFIANSALNPFKKPGRDMVLMRLRPYNPLFNLGIFIVAICWNILFFPDTLFMRYKDNLRIKAHVPNNQK